MDFLDFIKRGKEDPDFIANKPGLYLVQQNHLPAHLRAFRAGLAGKPRDSATAVSLVESTLGSRAASYLRYWMPTSGTIYACLTVPRRRIQGFTEKVLLLVVGEGPDVRLSRLALHR